MRQNIGISELTGERRGHPRCLYTGHIYVLNFLQTLVDILVKYASEIVVFDPFIDDSH